MGVRSQLSWFVKGPSSMYSALESLTADLQALQQQVAALQANMQVKIAAIDARQLDEFDKVRAAVAGATDDLMARVDALRHDAAKS